MWWLGWLGWLWRLVEVVAVVEVVVVARGVKYLINRLEAGITEGSLRTRRRADHSKRGSLR